MINLYKYEEIPLPLLQAHATNLFYCPAWLSVLQKHYGCDYYATTDSQRGEIMVFALIKCLTGHKLVSLPFSDYTSPGLLRTERLKKHVEMLRKSFPDMPVLLKVHLPNVSEFDLNALAVPTDKGCLHRVDTRKGIQLESNMTSGFRRGVRRAHSNGLQFETNCSTEGLEQFYNLFYKLRIQKHGLIPQPFAFFEKVYNEFVNKGNGFFVEVRKGGRLLASALVLQHENGLYYKWGCSSLPDLGERPNNLLFHELLHLAQRQGYDYVDLGLSDLKVNRGLVRFKRSMGGSESDIYTFQFLPDGYPDKTVEQFQSIVNAMASIVVSSGFDRKTTEGFSQALYPLFV